MPNFYASKVFLGAAAVSARGIFQADAVLVASQRRFLELADEVILLVDSNKFTTSSGGIVCKLDPVHQKSCSCSGFGTKRSRRPDSSSVRPGCQSAVSMKLRHTFRDRTMRAT